MHEALCRPSSTTLDIVHAEGGPPITQRTSGLDPEVASKIGEETKYPHCLDANKAPASAAIKSLPDFDASNLVQIHLRRLRLSRSQSSGLGNGVDQDQVGLLRGLASTMTQREPIGAPLQSS
jgi:hypothetical protein